MAFWANDKNVICKVLFNGSQLQKWKSTFPICHCHEIYREEAVGLKSSNYTLKYDFCEYVKFRAISLKIYILLITASLRFES